ncbi:MAG TPA: 3-isopropylmalate dehydratase [Trebonia sp.]|jgi:3-isopropylmalate/(R)-2-methylmalate dehydratase small subunit|nr:3-isopropylmalate dehydratase [Trebonia sp.]
MTGTASTDAGLVAPLTGRAWVFPQDYITTDAMMPRAGYDLAPREQDLLVLSSVRPGWAELVKPGDILVAGRNFGTGSSRPAPTLLRRLGIAAIVCESVAEIFQRNCVSYALPALDCPGCLEMTTEGDTVTVDLDHGTYTNVTTGVSRTGPVLPAMLRQTIAAGGAYELLRAEGYM